GQQLKTEPETEKKRSHEKPVGEQGPEVQLEALGNGDIPVRIPEVFRSISYLVSHSDSQEWFAAAGCSTGHRRGNIHRPQPAPGFFVQTEGQEPIYADRRLGLGRTHREHGGGDLCPPAARRAGEGSPPGNKASVHPAGLHAL